MSDPTQESAKPWLSDRYIPQDCLGRKAGRQTWLATDRVTGTPVVVKRLTFGRDFLWDDLKLFEREAQTLKSIDHPAIPKYLDFFDLELEGEQGFALVQSYIDARSLEEHVKSGRRFSEADLKEIAIQTLEILDYLHHCQPPVIHRDIKPSNILLAESDVGVGLVYLVDFGSVQSLAAREGSTITIVGTYGYMPPEQFGGRAYPSSDFYSLGATLIYLATGKHPADIPQGKDLRLNFEPLANLSLEMTGWIREMIHPLADERPDSAELSISKIRQQSIEKLDPAAESTCIEKIETASIDYYITGKTLKIKMLGKFITRSPEKDPFSGCVFVFFCFLTIVVGFISKELAVVLAVVFLLVPIVFVPMLISFTKGILEIVNPPQKTVEIVIDEVNFQIKDSKLTLGFYEFTVPKNRVWKISEFAVYHGRHFSHTNVLLSVERDTLIIALPESEGTFLAQELSDFLGLPISE
jgi:serine/threonine protein kinase